MPRPPRRCLACGQPHRPTRRAPSYHPACSPYRGSWRRLSERVRKHVTSCAYCGSTRDLTLDHIAPGRTDEGLRVLCRRCNRNRRYPTTHSG